jgi:hypothetical protein
MASLPLSKGINVLIGPKQRRKIYDFATITVTAGWLTKSGSKATAD